MNVKGRQNLVIAESVGLRKNNWLVVWERTEGQKQGPMEAPLMNMSAFFLLWDRKGNNDPN